MTKYQLVPYVVRVHVRGLPAETRPMGSLDGGTMNFADELNGMLLAHLGKTVVQDDTAATRPHRLRIDSVGKGDNTINFVVAPGKSGIKSDIIRPDGKAVSRDFVDTEHVPLRHYLAYGPNQHEGILLAERVGGDGAITALRTLIKQTWAARHDELTITIAPAGDEQLWSKVLAKRPVVKYQMTRPATPDGKLSVTKKSAIYTVDVRPPGRSERWSLKSARSKAKKADRSLRSVLLQDVSPVLAPGYDDPEDGAQSLMDEGWSVAVQLELESGQRPVVNVESDASVTLTFPIIEGQEEPTSLPETDDVLAAVQRLVTAGVFKANGIAKSRGAGLQWVAEPCKYEGSPWKVAWSVVD